jgi:hypothetical protein
VLAVAADEQEEAVKSRMALSAAKAIDLDNDIGILRNMRWSISFLLL